MRIKTIEYYFKPCRVSFRGETAQMIPIRRCVRRTPPTGEGDREGRLLWDSYRRATKDDSPRTRNEGRPLGQRRR